MRSLKGVFRSRHSRSQSPLPPSSLTPEPVGTLTSQSSSRDTPAQQPETNIGPASAAREIEASSVPIGEGQNYGINVLYDGGADASIDIVFVHGLTGNAYNTWLYNDKSIRVHWPSELLKQDLPDARILSYGYDADIVNLWNPRSHSSLTNHAENMVGALIRKRERTNTEDRKILFVGHSLGGLVIEHALSHSRKSVERFLRKMEQSTAGIVFLGVPHYGADLGAWESFGTHLANIVKRPNQDLLQVLKPGSEMLHLVENDFHKILRLRKEEDTEISITCFYEELDVRPIGQVQRIVLSYLVLILTHLGRTFTFRTDQRLSRICHSCKSYGISGDQNSNIIKLNLPRI